MSRYHSYLNSAKAILGEYTGEEPLSSLLKKKFAAGKKYGSKDRRQIAHLCYCYFRLGKMGMDLDIEERLLAGLFLCSESLNEILASIRPGWNAITSRPLPEKLETINADFKIEQVFPWQSELSNGIELQGFCNSFFIQPSLFLRLRPGKEEKVKKLLQQAGIDVKMIGSNCLEIRNAAKVDDLVALNKDAVVQDYNSQQTVGLLSNYLSVFSQDGFKAWDCCAASGGKSILLHDLAPAANLTVSDIRESVLANLKKRFAEAEIKNYKCFVGDLSSINPRTPDEQFDVIIADVPCSGSGTWSRTPEQLYFFNESSIGKYATLQKKIAGNVVASLRPGGFLLYITCSVFKAENEAVIAYLQSNYQLQIKEMKLFAGYQQQADTLFAAVLYKPL